MMHARECTNAPSESTQVIANINNSFHKHDLKFELARNQEQRRKMRPQHLAGGEDIKIENR